MKSIILNTGEFLYCATDIVELQENEIEVDEVPSEKFVKAFYNFDTKTFYETATEAEIIEANKVEVPNEVPLWRIKVILNFQGLEQTIVDALETLEEPIKTLAKAVWKDGTTIERTSQTVILLKNILQMTNEQLDDIFIQADKIIV